MRSLPACSVTTAIVLATSIFAACSGSRGRNEAAPPATSASATPPSQTVELVSATVVVNACPDAKTMNSRAARNAIQRLVDPCTAVPGGKAQFMAKLLPGGRIELASPEGDPEGGVVPTCVLKHNLRHFVFLKKPCTFDVLLEERPEAPRPAGG